MVSGRLPGSRQERVKPGLLQVEAELASSMSNPAGQQLCPSPSFQPSCRSAVFKALKPLEQGGFIWPLKDGKSLLRYQPPESLLVKGGGVYICLCEYF